MHTRLKVALPLLFILIALLLILPSQANASDSNIGQTTANLNIRASPSTDAAIIGKFPAGTQFQYIDRGDGWGQITIDSQTGYLSLDYVTEAQKEPATPAESSNGQPVHRIVIDPGHGGKDPGAIGNDTMEKWVALTISEKLQRRLLANGYDVKMTRSEDVFIPLPERATLSNNWKADLFVSVHANSATSSSAKGLESYYYGASSSGKQLASSIQTALVSNTNNANRGTHSADFYVLRHTSMPAVLVETGFISNPADAVLLNDAGYQDKVATSIAEGIKEYAS
ncbi:N-acetylmuramoyl-L-alanine amidase [Terribacillus sp. AE2B 122]|uniref:N-acetylmuramoyl-L-alanine amidase n=1 Tax=Terribacillus sp. AE2B 122 TaxID=1331902 RepID=UPI001440A1EB|nr:N-acetylmuramoyl-L-alanine amidase [Terribacillus sp. AE2B 122]VVM33666.1 N-acetylmuramoyl-L-alanine amidase (EC 3.5.1.28) [Terribacillus sp. AE2B 122]